MPDVAIATGQEGKLTCCVLDVSVKVEVLRATDVNDVEVCVLVVRTVFVMEVVVLVLMEVRVLVDV